jgi:arylsulfatase A-like enzyme/type IV secretory pathway VirB3-like protein
MLICSPTFIFMLVYLLKKLKKSKKTKYFWDLLIINILFSSSAISCSFFIVSELQLYYWGNIIYIILFCIIIPFLCLIIYLHINFNHAYKFLFAIGFSILLIIIEKNIVCPIRNKIFFNQSSYKALEIMPKQKESPNVIIIVMDTTRASNMSLYSYKRQTTPNLEIFAHDSVIFKSAISSSSWTLPSHASMFTGLFPAVHGADYVVDKDVLASALKQEFDTLAEILTGRGYHTGAFVSNFGWLTPGFGFSQGFNYYMYGYSRNTDLLLNSLGIRFLGTDNYNILRKISGISLFNHANRINQLAINWLKRKNKGPFFLFINYYETCGIEYLPFPYSKLFTNYPAIPRMLERDKQTGSPIISKGEYDKYVSWYDNELAYLDSQIGKFFMLLKKLNVYNNSLIIVTSDHGELLGEHSEFGHGFWLYQDLLHIPLIIKYPFNKQNGRVVSKPVQNIDIFAEILDKLKIKLPSNIQAQPLETVEHPIMSEVRRASTMSEKWPNKFNRDLIAFLSKKMQGYKLILSTDGQNELFDLDKDPNELNNIADLEKIKIIKKEIIDYLNSLNYSKGEEKTGKSKKLSEETEKILRTLGYIK